MAKAPSNHGQAWTSADLKKLRQLAREATPTRVVAAKLGRTTASVAVKASSEGISFKGTGRRAARKAKK